MTPRFLNSAKQVSNTNLDSIKDALGRDFTSSLARNEHIVQFYERLYKLPADAPAISDGSVRRFLGEEICYHSTV